MTTSGCDIISFRACHAVINNAELLENILLHLSIKDIILSYKVSSAWKDDISCSKALQEALYFKPRPLASVYALPPRADQFGDLLRISKKSHFDRDRLGNMDILRPAILNPLFAQSSEGKDFFVCYLEPSLFTQKRPQTQPDGTWSRMYLTQPPDVKCTLIVRDRLTLSYGRHAVFHVSEPTGITMGTLTVFITQRLSYFEGDLEVTVRCGKLHPGSACLSSYVSLKEDAMVVRKLKV